MREADRCYSGSPATNGTEILTEKRERGKKGRVERKKGLKDKMGDL